MTTTLALTALLLLPAPGPARADEDPVFATFASARDAYRAKRWEDADVALRRLLELLSAPEHSAKRATALPAYHFYAAAVAWERGDRAGAREQLNRYFAFNPDATLDPASYPPAFRQLFDACRDEAGQAASKAAPGPGPESIGGGTLPAYATRDVDTSAIPVNAGEEGWADGPVSALLSDGEKRAFQRLPDDDARRDFVERFWERLDPRPSTGENELQVEFYRRVQYCDATFSTERTRGALSDRGRVFLVLGPPSYAGRAPLLMSHDVMNTLRTTELTSVSDGKGGHAIVRVPSNRATVTPGDVDGEVETWYYRRDRIPRGVPFTELQYQFVTRRGYGEAVLQKESRELLALEKAARLLRREAGRE